MFVARIAFALALLTPAGLPAQTSPTPAIETNPKVAAAMKDGDNLKQRHQYIFAIDSYRKAAKLADGGCVKCLENIYDLQMGLGNYKDALGTAKQLEALAKGPQDRSVAEAEAGQAMLRQAGDKARPEQLEAVHAVFQSALTDYARNNSARYSDACVLARLGRTDEAGKEFKTCAAAAAPTDPMRMRAAHFAENPVLSMSRMAPAFEVTALDGSSFNLDNMGGKVVLIDFWATWCGPCKEELPHVKKIAKEFAGQPLVILSISWDADETRWKDFINKNEMTWLQYRDVDHSLSERFGIHSIPHYFTIDSDGVLTAEMIGSGSDVEGKLRKLIKRANDAKTTTLSAQTGGID